MWGLLYLVHTFYDLFNFQYPFVYLFSLFLAHGGGIWFAKHCMDQKISVLLAVCQHSEMCQDK